MQTETEALRETVAELQKENKRLWEEFLSGGQPKPEPDDKTLQMFKGETVAADHPGDERRALRPVSCPGCGGQNVKDGVCVHCGAPHEVWQ